MDNIISFNYKDQETKPPKEGNEEEEEEALSLCDFPLNSNEPDQPKDSSETHHHRRSSSQPSDFFEFFNDLSSDNTTTMSHAEDIISGGKLVPYKQPLPLFDDRILKSMSGEYEEDSVNLSRRYCESLPEINPTRSNSTSSSSTNIKLTRSSRSLDCRKLRRNSSLVMKSEASDVRRILSKGSEKSEGYFKGLSRPRWYALMFGPVKFPPEMELRDMKKRLVRRDSGPKLAGEKAPAKRSDRRSSSWGQDLLRVLSCRDHASLAVTAESVG